MGDIITSQNQKERTGENERRAIQIPKRIFYKYQEPF